MRSPNFASLGRCSLIFRPGALVSISLNGPPLSWPGLRSHRSIVAGPPFIHKRMTDRFGLVVVPSAAACASRPSQPETDTAVLTAPTRRRCRRSSGASNRDMGTLRGGRMVRG